MNSVPQGVQENSLVSPRDKLAVSTTPSPRTPSSTPSPRTPSSTPSPRTPKGISEIIDDIRNAEIEYREFKSVRETLKIKAQRYDLDEDYTGILGIGGGNQHAFGKGVYFRMAKSLLQLKQKDPVHFTLWFRSSEMELFQEAKKEFDYDVTLMKLALKTLIKSSLARHESMQSGVIKELEEAAESLSIYRRNPIEFKKIADLVSRPSKEKLSFLARSFDEGRDRMHVRSETAPIISSTSLGSSQDGSPKKLRRQYSRKVPKFYPKDKLHSVNEDENSIRSPEIRTRASSSPLKSSHVGKASKVTFSRIQR